MIQHTGGTRGFKHKLGSGAGKSRGKGKGRFRRLSVAASASLHRESLHGTMARRVKLCTMCCVVGGIMALIAWMVALPAGNPGPSLRPPIVPYSTASADPAAAPVDTPYTCRPRQVPAHAPPADDTSHNAFMGSLLLPKPAAVHATPADSATGHAATPPWLVWDDQVQVEVSHGKTASSEGASAERAALLRAMDVMVCPQLATARAAAVKAEGSGSGSGSGRRRGEESEAPLAEVEELTVSGISIHVATESSRYPQVSSTAKAMSTNPRTHPTVAAVPFHPVPHGRIVPA